MIKLTKKDSDSKCFSQADRGKGRFQSNSSLYVTISISLCFSLFIKPSSMFDSVSTPADQEPATTLPFNLQSPLARLWEQGKGKNKKNRSLRGHVLTGNECYTINIVYVIVDMVL